jgi:myo-inositol-1(or 4)-monophosphatase
MLSTAKEKHDLCQAVCRVAQEAGYFVQEELHRVSQRDIVEKDRNSLVSYVDIEVEKRLVRDLGNLFPRAGFITEEGTVSVGEKEWNWIIDPLDGTTNFLFRVPFYCVSIALEHKGELVLGVIHEPNTGECFYAWQGGGAWLNEHKISVSTQNTLANSLVATGFPYQMTEQTERLYEVLKYAVRSTHGIRRLGSAALDLAYVACGRFDVYYEAALNPWDIAAGVLLVREAGGTVTDFAGETTASAAARSSRAHRICRPTSSSTYRSWRALQGDRRLGFFT